MSYAMEKGVSSRKATRASQVGILQVINSAQLYSRYDVLCFRFFFFWSCNLTVSNFLIGSNFIMIYALCFCGAPHYFWVLVSCDMHLFTSVYPTLSTSCTFPRIFSNGYFASLLFSLVVVSGFIPEHYLILLLQY